MAFRRSDWPLTPSQLKTVISLGETTLVELKREWWPLDKQGQAKLARQVMALANAVRPDELSLLIFGVEDERRGGRIVPVQGPPGRRDGRGSGSDTIATTGSGDAGTGAA